jgi:DNA (cytosine-5)-methyltransferase 1
MTMTRYEVLVGLLYDTRGQYRPRMFSDEPCCTILNNPYHYEIVYYLTDTPPDNKAEDMNKPPYRVPSMAEIANAKWNGYNVISTFSGCGGSSLGYKMAGYKVLWANEFIPAAQETYRANHPNTILDTRDIREVSADSILNAIGMQPGELDVFDGSPPCASFSTSGKRERGWGKVKKYSDTEQRVDDLFFEYARLIKGVQPKVFVAENVSGLVKGTAKGYFSKFWLR